jgi:precorrin-2 dehydrogenase/sirohydrochlorin ferrochelatase
MKYYPIQLDVTNRPCLVVGAGNVGTRKIKTLITCGAVVTVVSPAVSEDVLSLELEGLITLKKKAYEEKDLHGMFLVIGATGDESVNRQISRDAQKMSMLCNIADLPDACNFILPAIVERGDLLLAVSTSGKSPAFAKKLRKDLEKQFGEEYSVFLTLMGNIRLKLLSEAHEPEAHKPLFEKIIENDLLGLIRENRVDDINALLSDVLGEGYVYENLMENNT